MRYWRFSLKRIQDIIQYSKPCLRREESIRTKKIFCRSQYSVLVFIVLKIVLKGFQICLLHPALHKLCHRQNLLYLSFPFKKYSNTNCIVITFLVFHKFTTFTALLCSKVKLIVINDNWRAPNKNINHPKFQIFKEKEKHSWTSIFFYRTVKIFLPHNENMGNSSKRRTGEGYCFSLDFHT